MVLEVFCVQAVCVHDRIQFGTKMDFVDFEVKRSKAEVILRPHVVK